MAGTGWTRPFWSLMHERNGWVDPSRGAQRLSFAMAVPFNGRVGALLVSTFTYWLEIKAALPQTAHAI
jgi:hypothetical protein